MAADPSELLEPAEGAEGSGERAAGRDRVVRQAWVLGVLLVLSVPLAVLVARKGVLRAGGLGSGVRALDEAGGDRGRALVLWLGLAVVVWYADQVVKLAGYGVAQSALGREAVLGGDLRGQAIMTGGAVVGMAAAAAACGWIGGRAPGSGVRPAGAGDAARGAWLGLGLILLCLPAVLAVGQGTALGVELARGPIEEMGHETLRALDAGRGVGFVPVAVVILGAVVVAPVTEELIYRGLLQTGLAGLAGSRWAGVLLTSGVFVLMHVGAASWHTMPTLLALSVAMGAAFERTGRIATPIVMHVAFNALNVALVLMS